MAERDQGRADQGSADIVTLHRMITYVREEAIRLRVMEVAILLEHAEEVVTAFSPGPSSEEPCPDAAPPAGHIEH